MTYVRNACIAVQVREAVFCCGYQRLFSLYEAAPNMGRALMDIAFDRFRHSALTMAVRAFKPHIQVRLPSTCSVAAEPASNAAC